MGPMRPWRNVRPYPTADQRTTLAGRSGCARTVHNDALRMSPDLRVSSDLKRQIEAYAERRSEQ